MKRILGNDAFSTVELMIAVTMISIFFLAIISSFFNINRGLLISKTRTLATNLAQEKIESSKNISYFRLIPTSLDDLNTYGYDKTYYVPETLFVGDTSYERRIAVYKVAEDADGEIQTLSPTAEDTGLKQIKVTVLWTESGEQKTLELTNLRDNPNRTALNGTITGTVYEYGTMAPVYQAQVSLVENQNYTDTTDTNGKFSLKVATDTYNLQVSHRSCFPAVDGPFTVETGQTIDRDVYLTKKSSGTVKGYAFVNRHLIMTMLISGTTLDQQIEFIEVYNPTNQPITIGSTYFYLKSIAADNTISNVPLTWSTSDPITISTGAHLLMASTAPLTIETYYPSGAMYSITPDILFPMETIIPTNMGLAIADQYGVAFDSAGWYHTGHAAPTNGRETTGLNCGAAGFDAGGTMIRCIYYTENTRWIGYSQSNAMDTDNNSYDFVFYGNSSLNGRVLRKPRKTTDTTLQALCGYPAFGAVCYADDGLSTAAIAAQPSGSIRSAKFNLTNIATGQWTISISSSEYYYESTANVSANGITDKGWVVLSSPCVNGFITGSVYSGSAYSAGTAVNNILVKAGIYEDRTDTNGNFRIPVPPGGYYVIANYGNDDADYIEVATNYAITVSSAGEVITLSPTVSPYYFNLKSGGGLTGRVVINNGIDPLPNVSVLVYGSGEDTPYATALTDNNGYYELLNLCTTKNDHIVVLQLDSGESSTPINVTETVLSGQTVEVSTFVVTSAYGKFVGTVKNNGVSIKTGILVMATTSTISTDPPEIGDPSSTNLYYATISNAEGTYSLEVRGGYSYNVYAWYTSAVTSSLVTYSRKNSNSNSITAGHEQAVDFEWP
ncbi:MAG: carboxypeptidase regulatory-like domain-containing protein [Elusimicrobiota bacterium]